MNTNETKLRSHLSEARGKSTRTLTIEYADSVLRSLLRVPALPTLAEEHSRAVSDNARNPSNHVRDEGKAKQRAFQWSRWYSDVRTEIDRDGVGMLADLEKWAPDDHTRFDRGVERVVALLRALRDLNLPWWPSHMVDRHAHLDLNLLDFVERELGRLETAQLRRSGSRPTLFDAMAKLPPRTAPRDLSIDDWKPTRAEF